MIVIMKNLSHLICAFCIFTLGFGLLAAHAHAQDPGQAITAKGLISVDKVRQGSTFQAAVVMDIGSGFHTNANKPLDANLIPTKLELPTIEGISFDAVSYPKGESEKFSFSDQPLLVYSGHIIFKFTAHAAANLPIGAQSIKAKLKYQACNNQACFPPKTVEVAIPIEVVDANSKTAAANSEIFAIHKSRK
jgi:thiol:disulfide interchange protein